MPELFHEAQEEVDSVRGDGSVRVSNSLRAEEPLDGRREILLIVLKEVTVPDHCVEEKVRCQVDIVAQKVFTEQSLHEGTVWIVWCVTISELSRYAFMKLNHGEQADFRPSHRRALRIDLIDFIAEALQELGAYRTNQTDIL